MLARDFLHCRLKQESVIGRLKGGRVPQVDLELARPCFWVTRFNRQFKLQHQIADHRTDVLLM